ncbi:unnamed protein product [Allacma fusca]|uniref:RING-type domain-containing protein n=1 Tax=Allacma fusca TaxID=39272 RepID=A0A8J2JIP0_9HEXA|nr:unnamed protein product [Allacma fusca]
MEGNFTCALCLDFTSDHPSIDYFVTTECGHIFHHLCLKPAYDGGHNKCPICRRKIIPENWRKLFGIQAKEKLKRFRAFSDHNPSGSSSQASGSPDNEYDFRFKIILVGNGGVGKSCLMQRFSDGVYSTNVLSTVACDWRSKVVTIGNKRISLSIWDTAGQERHRSLVTNYVRDTHGALIVYDITDPSSLDDISIWDKFVTDNSLPETVKILIGNKTDLDTSRQIPKDHGKTLARKLGMSFFETSAKDSYNVEAAFRTLAAKILETDSLIKSIESKKKNPTVQLKRGDQHNDGVFTACSQSLLWVKNGFNATVSSVKSGWKSTRSSR